MDKQQFLINMKPPGLEAQLVNVLHVTNVTSKNGRRRNGGLRRARIAQRLWRERYPIKSKFWTPSECYIDEWAWDTVWIPASVTIWYGDKRGVVFNCRSNDHKDTVETAIKQLLEPWEAQQWRIYD